MNVTKNYSSFAEVDQITSLPFGAHYCFLILTSFLKPSSFKLFLPWPWTQYERNIGQIRISCHITSLIKVECEKLFPVDGLPQGPYNSTENGWFRDTIKCLISADLHERWRTFDLPDIKPTPISLSYHWGDMRVVVQLDVEGHMFFISDLHGQEVDL